MAKNKIKVDVEVTDKGTLKQVGDKAKKAAAGLDSVSKTGKITDRTLKGTAAASSNSTKNFSKMAQGINGGLVPAYATLAANLFAVSAAFNFLKDAGNLVTLQKGQEAYAGATGVALRSLSNDIIAATDAQINFTDASQAAAIGTASGLSGEQLTKLGTAAKDASLILGRDVTDSFNRLVRGVTKAEPELLDELGIILRLDDATRKYADSLNLNQKDLTAFQRSQAVANDVLEQAEQKYSRIIAVVDPGVNTFNKLGKSFDDIINTIKEFAAVTLGPFAEAISQFPALGVALLGVFGKGVLTAALPGLRDIGERAKESAEAAQESFDKAKDSLKDYTTETRVANKEAAASRAKALGDPGFKSRNPNSGFEMIKQGRGKDLSSQQIVGMQRAVQNNKKMSKQMKAQWKSALNEMLLATKTSTRGIEQEFKKTTGKIGLFFRQAEVQVKGAFASMKLAAASFAGFAATALSVISWVSLIATLGVTVYQFFKTKKATDESSEALDYASEKVSELNDEFKNFNKIQNIITEDGAASLKYFTALGERITSVGLGTLEPLFEQAISEKSLKNFEAKVKESEERIKSLQNSIERVTSPSGQRNRMSASQRAEANGLTGALSQQTKTVEKLSEEIESLSMNFGDYLNSSDDQRLKDLGKYFTDQTAALTTISENLGGKGSATIIAYLNTLEQLTNSTDLTTESAKALFNQLKEQQVGVSEVTQLFKDYERGLQDVLTQSDQLRNSFMGMTAAESAVAALETQIDLTLKLAKENGGLTDEQAKQLNIVALNLEFAKALDNVEKNKLTRAKELALRTEKDLRGQTKRQADLINLDLKSQELQNNRKYIEEQIAIIENQREAITGNLNNQQQTALNNLHQELDLNREKEKSLERQKDLAFQILDSANQALESSLQSNIASVLKGEEKNIKDAILKIGQAVSEGIVDTISGQLTDMIMGTNPLVKAQQGALTVANALTDGAAAVGAEIRAAMGADLEDFVGPPTRVLGAADKKSGGMFSPIKDFLFGKDMKAKVLTDRVEDDGSFGAPGTDSQKRLKVGGLFSPIINFFSETENPFFKGLKGLFSKDNPLLKGLGAIFSNIMPILGGLFSGGLGGFLGFANGGMVKGGFQAYANGGIATRPTLGLVGEGRYNEAIVPMPNGKAIPVDMKGAGQQNNVTVNVSVDSQGNASTNMQQDSAQAGNLGQVIARAVQQELQNQKRSGGILNPYGAA